MIPATTGTPPRNGETPAALARSEASGQTDDTANPTDLCAEAQRVRLLTEFHRVGSVTTLGARQHLCVMHPAARVMELRRRGIDIATVWTREADALGVEHRVARYVLLSGGTAK